MVGSDLVYFKIGEFRVEGFVVNLVRSGELRDCDGRRGVGWWIVWRVYLGFFEVEEFLNYLVDVREVFGY